LTNAVSRTIRHMSLTVALYNTCNRFQCYNF